ncbi:MAG: hypothetical protein JWN71_2836 [Xanthobacteraceae bacterium]|jgi:hypothetical protein|nr:hypothetical protein [Xanthobacteraceae bacterium]
MTQKTSRDTSSPASLLVNYRQRAADLAEKIKDLPAEERAEALRHHKALLHLAAIDDWVSSTPRARLFNEYKLDPRPLPPSSQQVMGRLRNRQD